MALKRNSLECATWLAGKLAPQVSEPPSEPKSIFVLRNNDIGDLLVITPLFEALKRRFPRAKIIAGIGSWNFDVLKNNPHVDEILPVNAPWHNGKTAPHGVLPALRYIASSGEVKNLATRRCDIGIDVLGSAYGSLLMMRAGIPFRLGVRGYAGGHSAVQRCVNFDAAEHVGRAALRFAELLGATELPENRPQIFLQPAPQPSGAIVIAPGGSLAEKCWPMESYLELARLLAPRKIIVIGGKEDRPTAAKISGGRAHIVNLAGELSLAETFRVIAGSARVICNSSMAMHAAAAFRKPCFVLLGGWHPSAAAHATQWCYPESRVLGGESGGRGVYSPGEVFDLVSAT